MPNTKEPREGYCMDCWKEGREIVNKLPCPIHSQEPREWEKILTEVLPTWFGVYETTQTRMAGGIVDYEVKFTKGGLKEFVLPEIIKFIHSVESQACKEEREKIVEIIEKWGRSRLRGGYENSELYQILSSLSDPEGDKGL